jgi:hypothetical protein
MACTVHLADIFADFSSTAATTRALLSSILAMAHKNQDYGGGTTPSCASPSDGVLAQNDMIMPTLRNIITVSDNDIIEVSDNDDG